MLLVFVFSFSFLLGSALITGSNVAQVKTVFEKDDMAQLFIKTNSFTEVSLRMGFDKEKEPVKLYATRKSVKNVKRVREYTKKECTIIICDAHISDSRDEIRTLEKKNIKLNRKYQKRKIRLLILVLLSIRLSKK